MAQLCNNNIESTVVVMVPIPAQSHLNQLLRLSTLISSHGIKVHFLGSETHNRQAKLRSSGGLLDNTLSGLIQFHNLPTPPISSPDPDPHASDKTPFHIAPATSANMSLGEHVASFVQGLFSSSSYLKAKRVVLIYDRLLSVAVRDAAKIPNVESYGFNCLSAFNLFYTLWDAKGRPFEVDVIGELQGFPSVNEFMLEGVIQFILSNNVEERSGDIHNTSRVIDDTFIELMAREAIMGGNKKQWAIMPTIIPILRKSINSDDVIGEKISKHYCLEWLDRQDPRSVIYVSFGTSVSLSDEEAKEIAFGLQQSKHKFIWVLRDADRADIFAKEARKIELPQGFEESVGENYGLVIRDWAPQLEILAHKSIGGFMTHCGWNSCFESLSSGVPIAAWPMHSDQPLNAMFFTRILKVGLMVREWDKRGEPVKAVQIKDIVERLIDPSEEGDHEIRKRVEEISVAIKNSMEEGGEACSEFDAFIAHITR